jgi:hypothetical protein
MDRSNTRLLNTVSAGGPPPPRRVVSPGEDIIRVRRLAEAVRDGLPAAGEALPQNIKPEQIEAVRRLADATIRRSEAEVRIGVVGGFNAGKSLLLRALIGTTELLPVDDRPTTGNITALSLRSEPDRGQTEAVGRAVEWMDEETAAGCLGVMLAEATRKAASVPAIDQQTPAGLGPLFREARWAAWPQIEAWCEASWARCGEPPNPEVRSALYELVWFGRCCTSPAGRALLASGPGRADLTAGLAEALTLTAGADVTGEFARVPRGPGAATPPQPLTADFVRAVFPLIRRVHLDVRIPDEVWRLTEHPDSPPFMLLDCPGLGAAGSTTRDAFLCEQAMWETETILIVLNASMLGADAGQRLFSQLQKARGGRDLRTNTLAVVNRFDQYTDEPVPDPAGPVEDTRRFRERLDQMLADATRLTASRERVALTSSLYALDRLADAWPVGTGTEELRAKARHILDRWYREGSRGWQLWADRLAGEGRHGPLPEMLRAVVHDGGVGRLRVLIADHVAEHGLSQLADSVVELGYQLKAAYDALPRQVDVRKADPRPTLEAIREQIRALHGEYYKLQSAFRRTPPELMVREADLRPLAGQPEFRDLLPPADSGPPGEMGLYRFINDCVREGVWNWPGWGDVLSNLQDGRLILTGQSVFDDAPIQPPADSQEFYPRFETTLATCWRLAEELSRLAVPHLLEQLAGRVRSSVAGVTAALADARLDQRLQALNARPPGQAADQIKWLRWATEPSRNDVQELFLKAVGKDARPADPPRAFPLPGAETEGSVGWSIPWSNTLKDPNEVNDQILLDRLRNQLVKGARTPLLRWVQRFNQVINSTLDEFLTRCVQRLQLVVNNPDLLRALAGDAAGSRERWGAEKLDWSALPARSN